MCVCTYVHVCVRAHKTIDSVHSSVAKVYHENRRAAQKFKERYENDTTTHPHTHTHAQPTQPTHQSKHTHTHTQVTKAQQIQHFSADTGHTHTHTHTREARDNFHHNRMIAQQIKARVEAEMRGVSHEHTHTNAPAHDHGLSPSDVHAPRTGKLW